MNINSPDTRSKQMNKNILVVLGGAILAAVLVAVLVQITLGGKNSGSGDVIENSVMVLVAARDLDAGLELQDNDMMWAAWPESAVFKSAIVQKHEDEIPSEVVSGRLERPVAEGEAIVGSAILKETNGNLVVARLNKGERAISIKVKAESMVSGFIRPGSYVDVILTYKHVVKVDNKEPAAVQNMVKLNLDRLATETILEKVRVLAIDQRSDYEADDEAAIGKTVTLAVPSLDAEKLALADEMGTITLAMRGVGDEEPNPEGPTLSDARLTKIDDEINEVYESMKKQSGVETGTVKIFNGAQMTEVPVR